MNLTKFSTKIAGAFALAASVVSCSSSCDLPVVAEQPTTYCNPIDVSTRLMINGEVRREAADPTMVFHKGTYYLFASKTGGYWYSDDLMTWTLVVTDEIPTEDYAPTAISLRDTIFFTASVAAPRQNPIYKSADPKSGKWELAKQEMNVTAWDPCFYEDDDKRLYFYWGCSNVTPMYGAELDPYTFQIIGERKALITSDHESRGWECAGDYNTGKDLAPWIEGAWMNKHNGKYYYQYAAPDACFKSYCDGVMVSDSPLGEFTLAPHNAFAAKPEGFICGAGHGSTFEDTVGNMWHVGSASVSVKHRFERRVTMFPTLYDEKDNLYMHSRFGDYPTFVPTKKLNSGEDFETGWMLLSFKKAVEVSSQMEGYPAENIVNEDVRTYWSAKSGDEGEWAVVDLGDICDINAIQVNFAEHNSSLHGRVEGIVHQYFVESSRDGETWMMVKDDSQSLTDNTHNYIELARTHKARYIRVTNVKVPDGTFTISGLRVFGLAEGSAPAAVSGFKVERSADDRRDVTLKWNKVEGADGYNITFGVAPDMMYHNYMVHDATEVTIRTLDKNFPYHFTIEPFNACGVGESLPLVEAK